MKNINKQLVKVGVLPISLERMVQQLTVPEFYSRLVDDCQETGSYLKDLQHLGRKIETRVKKSLYSKNAITSVCIEFKDFLLKFNKYNNSIYLSIYNRKTSENHDLVYVNSKTNLGSFNHRFSSIKDESQFIIYNKTKGLGNIADKISEKWGELRFILTDAF